MVDLLEQAKSGVTRINNVLYNLRMLLNSREEETDVLEPQEAVLLRRAEEFERKISEAFESNLNVLEALSKVFELTKIVNINMKFIKHKRVVKRILLAYKNFSAITCHYEREENIKPPEPEKELIELIQKRDAARKRNDWAASDKIRNSLKEKGIILEDTANGTRWRLAE